MGDIVLVFKKKPENKVLLCCNDIASSTAKKPKGSRTRKVCKYQFK